MMRYWHHLMAVRRPSDRYDIQTVIPSDVYSGVAKRQSTLLRALHRKVAYPVRIKNRVGSAAFAHVLDHSWADMLAFVPSGVKKVVTVHDLIPLRYPGALSAAQLKRFRLTVEWLKRADALISVSEYTKREIIHWLQIDPLKIHVVPNGTSLEEGAEATNGRVATVLKERSDHFRVGSLGSILQRKNLGIFSKALAKVEAVGGRAPILVRAGMKVDDELADEFSRAFGEDGWLELGSLDRNELEQFYRGIDVLVIPSFYEGFGLPVLEAMARGVPVLAADSSSLPEVGGDAALYFSPDSPDELAERLESLSDPVLYERLSREGLQRAREFSWRRTLEGLYDVYDRLQ
ncbi:alpha-maltose-1-phosphate synthase [Haloferula sargassicola]|uniref:Alpha-maltose-1-phosphate synthase n=2 Tax=Haloferula sargassicola TaxID=490096 RepID=A0ABP9UQZ4_9BACT